MHGSPSLELHLAIILQLGGTRINLQPGESRKVSGRTNPFGTSNCKRDRHHDLLKLTVRILLKPTTLLAYFGILRQGYKLFAGPQTKLK